MIYQESSVVADKGLSGITVLVVEDDYYLAEDTRDALESAGAQVLGPFAHMQDAQKPIDESEPDCAVLDINLGSGPDFTSAEAMLDRGVPLMFVTGYDRSTIPEKLSHVACLQKPTNRRKLVDAVRELCGR